MFSYQNKMLFTQDQILKLLGIIEKNTIIYIASSLGTSSLSEADKIILRKYGIDWTKFNIKGWTPAEKAFYFGRLSQALGDKQTKKLKYGDFIKYMEGGKYIPLSKNEQYMLDLAKNRSYSHIKGLGEMMKQDVNGIILEEDQKKRIGYEEAIRSEIKRGIEERKSLQTIMSDIGHRTDDWQRNLGRIVQTEYNNIYQEGRAAQILEKYGEDARVYKDVFPGACRHCIKAYLTDGIGSKPIVFELGELIKNGTNIGVKVGDWRPVVGSTHPYCRCSLRSIFPGQEWDEEKKEFRYPESKEEDQTLPNEKRDKIIIGDKIMYV